MLDPFPPPPRFLLNAIKPFADYFNLATLPLHIHEVILATAFYTFTCTTVAPLISANFFPKYYSKLSRRQKLNWDVHIVSFVQAMVINSLCLYAIWFDEERKQWRGGNGSSGADGGGLEWEGRLWGYYGYGGLCQSFALGYFLWDLCICTLHPDIFGLGMVAHAVSAVLVFGLGYRPYIYFSCPIFLLYELSSPFLNIHWFCDKLDLTGSTLQAVNGVCLVVTFFGCRLCWGLYSSVWVFKDMFHLVRKGHTDFNLRVPSGQLHVYSTDDLYRIAADRDLQAWAFNVERYTPLWIPLVYLASNVVLNSLNLFWFGKMIETIRTRFDPPWGTKGIGPEKILYQPPDPEDSDLGVGEPGKRSVDPNVPAGKGSIKAARERAEEALNRPVGTVTDTKVERNVDADGHASIEVTGSTRKSGTRSRRQA